MVKIAITSGIWGMSVQSVRCWAQKTRERGMSDEHNQCCSSTQSIRSPLH